MTFGQKMRFCPKEKKLPQAELAKQSGIDGDIIEKYERNENSHLIEMAFKNAKVFDVPVDYFLGEGKHSTYDNDFLKRIEEIQVLRGNTTSVLFNLIDTYIRDVKARLAYK